MWIFVWSSILQLVIDLQDCMTYVTTENNNLLNFYKGVPQGSNLSPLLCQIGIFRIISYTFFISNIFFPKISGSIHKSCPRRYTIQQSRIRKRHLIVICVENTHVSQSTTKIGVNELHTYINNKAIARQNELVWESNIGAVFFVRWQEISTETQQRIQPSHVWDMCNWHRIRHAARRPQTRL